MTRCPTKSTALKVACIGSTPGTAVPCQCGLVARGECVGYGLLDRSPSPRLSSSSHSPLRLEAVLAPDTFRVNDWSVMARTSPRGLSSTEGREQENPMNAILKGNSGSLDVQTAKGRAR
jgi:hypothetical protein